MQKKEFSEKTKEKLLRKIKRNDKTLSNAAEIMETNLDKNSRKIILERDNFTCQYCRKREYYFKSSLHIHHIDYNPNNNDFDNLITLCPRCHRNTNVNRSFWEGYLRELVLKKKNL